MNNLKQKTINGMIWTVSERLSLQLVQLIVSIIIARLLEPSEFGLIGMLTIFTALAQSILDSGFGSALIQKKNASQVDASSIFYLNLIVGLILALILNLCAPFIAKFYQQPILSALTRVLSINLIINAFSLVQSSLLTKNMNFNIQLKVSLLSVLLSGTIGVTMASQGMGVWSLVAQIVANSLFKAIFLWIFSRWRPSFVFSFSSIKTMFSFGSNLLISGVIEIIFRNIYQTFIGKVYSAVDLGYYSRAMTIETAATQATSTSLSKVMYPALSPFQDDDITLKQAYQKTIRFSLFLHFPLMVGLIAVADPLIRFLLTEKWAPSISIFQLLCVVGLTYPLQILNLNILKVKGRSDVFIRLQITNKVLTLLVIALTFQKGISALLYGQIVTSFLTYFIYSFYSGRMINYSLFNQIKDLIPSLGKALLMGISMYIISTIEISNNFFMLFLQIIIGFGTYFLVNYAIKSPELFELLVIFKETLRSIFSKVNRK
jgi:O-antigen/teichoic acid export membrane protein